jgi:hypothetical protein
MAIAMAMGMAMSEGLAMATARLRAQQPQSLWFWLRLRLAPGLLELAGRWVRCLQMGHALGSGLQTQEDWMTQGLGWRLW